MRWAALVNFRIEGFDDGHPRGTSVRFASPDALRGFALLGVGTVNAPLQAGFDPVDVPLGALDAAVAFCIALPLRGKAFALFSLPFGWSFGAARAACAGDDRATVATGSVNTDSPP